MAQTTATLTLRFPWWWRPLFGLLRVAAFLGWRPSERALTAFSAWLGQEIADNAIIGVSPRKGGHNKLGRWKRFGGSLKRPAAPAKVRNRP